MWNRPAAIMDRRRADDRLSCCVALGFIGINRQSNRRAMKFRALKLFSAVARKSCHTLRRRFRRPLAGQFQAYSHTLPDRYPWLFEFAKANIRDSAGAHVLSFGCSHGEEVFTLRKYFPTAFIKGIDIEPSNVSRCGARARSKDASGITFAVAANTQAEPAEYYDAIFCLAVLCLGDLTVSGARRSDPYLYFNDFERMVTDFSRCLRPGGILLLHTTNFRFGDTAVSRNFDIVFEASHAQLAPDVLFDSNNRLLSGARYLPVAFRKRYSAMQQ
jgi:SAM-dependent methyltransferase